MPSPRTESVCIADGCGQRFDTSAPETRDNLRSFWQRYCPPCRTKGNAGTAIVAEPAPISLPEFIAKHGIKFECRRVESRADGLMSDVRPNTGKNLPHFVDTMRHFRCRITAPCCTGKHSQKKMVGFGLYFSQGSAHTEDPTLADVLDCLASDASGYDGQTFENWASDYGYDTDSRKAEKTFRAIKRQSEQLRRTIGQDAYEELLYKVERL